MADPKNPYCSTGLPIPGRGSPFYGPPPTKANSYGRGDYGRPIYGEYRDRWTGSSWIRGDGSKAPLAGLGEQFNLLNLPQAPFVANAATGISAKVDDPNFQRAMSAATAPHFWTTQNKLLTAGIAAVSAFTIYTLLKKR